jgi:hypothetical protein
LSADFGHGGDHFAGGQGTRGNAVVKESCRFEGSGHAGQSSDVIGIKMRGHGQVQLAEASGLKELRAEVLVAARVVERGFAIGCLDQHAVALTNVEEGDDQFTGIWGR